MPGSKKCRLTGGDPPGEVSMSLFMPFRQPFRVRPGGGSPKRVFGETRHDAVRRAWRRGRIDRFNAHGGPLPPARLGIDALGEARGVAVGLRTTVDMMLASLHPCASYGAQGASSSTTTVTRGCPRARHPSALGLPTEDVWPELWDELAPLIDRTFRGESFAFRDQPLVMTRKRLRGTGLVRLRLLALARRARWGRRPAQRDLRLHGAGDRATGARHGD